MWPEVFAIRHAIAWNRRRARRAELDANREDIKVPRSARGMTADEYRDSRLRDAARHHNNIRDLEELLA